MKMIKFIDKHKVGMCIYTIGYNDEIFLIELNCPTEHAKLGFVRIQLTEKEIDELIFKLKELK